ncbi:MAG: XkdQ/YqbQ family protein [Bacillota bacterium]
MIQVMNVDNGQTTDITTLVESAEWSGTAQKAVRKLAVSLVHAKEGDTAPAPIKHGSGIVLRFGEEELFRGIVFGAEYKPGKLSLTAYDQLIYLTNNKDSYVFKSMKASAVLNKLCSDFSIPAGTIEDTAHVISHMVCDEETLFDMVKKALDITYKNKGVRFSLFTKEGKVQLVPFKKNSRKWIIETGVNLIDYSYGESIENTVTKVKLQGSDGKQTIIATAENKSLQKQFGVLQHYEKVKDKANRAQLQDSADVLLAEKGKVKKTLRLDEVLGITEVISGTTIVVKVPELEIEQTYAVEEDTHHFNGRYHKMSLALTEMT